MKDLTKGNEAKIIFLFALPMLLGNVFQMIYQLVDRIVVGNYIGKEAIAAVGASFPVIFVMVSLIIGVSTGATIIIGQNFGAKKYDEVKKAVDTLFIFLFFSSIVITIIGVLMSESIFEMMKLPKEIIPQAVLFFNVYVSGFIFMFGFNGVSAILRGLGDSKTPLYFLIISIFVNIVLVWLFIAVFKWGIATAALSTVIAQAVSFILSIVYLNKFHDVLNFSYKNIKFDKKMFITSLKIGIPSGLQQAFVALGMMALFRIVNGFGTDVIAAYSVAGTIDSFAALPAMNFSLALSTFVAQNIGANKTDRVKKGYIATMWMTSALSIFVTICVIFFGEFLMGLFTHDAEVIRIGVNYLVIVSSFYVVFSAMFTNNGVMRGAGDTLIPMFITLFSLWIIRIPSSYFLSKEFGTNGIWWGIPLAWVIGYIFSYIYYKMGKWKTKKLVKHEIKEEFVENSPEMVS